MNSKCKFWPLDDNSEGEIYDNLAWDLPGYRNRKSNSRVKSRRRPSKSGKAYMTSP
jgi:hypothetical protein